MHGPFLENFVKSWKLSLVTYNNIYQKAVPTRERQDFVDINYYIGAKFQRKRCRHDGI